MDRISLDYYLMKSYISQISSDPMRRRLLGILTETAIDTGGFMAYGPPEEHILSMDAEYGFLAGISNISRWRLREKP